MFEILISHSLIVCVDQREKEVAEHVRVLVLLLFALLMLCLTRFDFGFGAHSLLHYFLPVAFHADRLLIYWLQSVAVADARRFQKAFVKHNVLVWIAQLLNADHEHLHHVGAMSERIFALIELAGQIESALFRIVACDADHAVESELVEVSDDAW